MVAPGGAAVPLKQIWRWKSEVSEYPHCAGPEKEINKLKFGLVGPDPEVGDTEEEAPGPCDMIWENLRELE